MPRYLSLLQVEIIPDTPLIYQTHYARIMLFFAHIVQEKIIL